MGRSKWLLLLLIPMLFGFDTRNPFRTRGPIKIADFTIGTGAGCTDGVDCYCDIASATGLLTCEDFENPDFYESGSGDWSKGLSDGGLFNRGVSSDWFADYGNGAFETLFKYADGVPTVGTRCSYGAGSPGGLAGCSGQREYCSTAQAAFVTGSGGAADCWGPNVNAKACIDIQRSGDFNAELGTLSLTNGNGESIDVGGGNAHMAFRTPANPSNSNTETACGKNGTETFSNSTDIGVTMAVAYGSNTASADIISGPWKHDEWFGSDGGIWEEFWLLGNTGLRSSDGFPFSGFMFTSGFAACSAALAGATVSVGQADCVSTSPFALRLGTNSAQYTQSVDWPFGTWGCVQGHISGMGTTNMSLEIKFNGTTVFSMTGFNGTVLRNQYYSGFHFNNYTNQNGGGAGYNGTDQVAYRYQDNIHVKTGAPVSCAAIGF